jgi:hypothetical protein
MSTFPSGAVDAARQLRELFDARVAVRKALTAIEKADGDHRHQRAFDLAVHHGAIRAVGYVLDWPPAERGQWLDTLLSDGATRAFVDELLQRASKPAVRFALAGAMPGSFPNPDAAAWDALRARLRSQPDEPIWGDPEGTALRKLWVAPRCERVKPTKRPMEPLLAMHDRDDAPGEAVDDALEAITRRLDEGAPRLVFVYGAAGLGKSSLCLMLADRLAARDDLWPVLVRLRDVDPQRQLLPEVERVLGVAKGVFTQGLAAVPRLVLILDGFDELGDASRGGNAVFLSQVRDALREGTVHATVVTGRDTLRRERDALTPEEAEVFRLLPFDLRRVRAWCKAWREATGHTFDGARFWREDEREDSLRDIASHPLMLYMLARMEAAGKSLDEAGDHGRFAVYRTIVDWCCLRHRELRPKDVWNERVMRRFLRAAGFASMAKGRDVLHLDDLRDAIVALGLEVGDDSARFAAERAVLFFARRGPDEMTWEFTHRSFGEYLAAEWLAAQTLPFIERASTALDPDERWRLDAGEATREWMGAFGIVQLPERVLRGVLWLLDEADPSAHEKLRERLGEVYRSLIEESEAEEAIRVARRWGTKPNRVRGVALANLFMVAGAKVRFRPEEVYPGHFLEAAHAIRAVVSGGDLRSVYLRVGLQGLANGYVRASGPGWHSLEFCGIDASGCNFSGASMATASFWLANLDRALFRDALLPSATFLDCTARGADFRGAFLAFARWIGGSVSNTNFAGVDLTGASFLDVDTDASSFEDANLQEAVLKFWGTHAPIPPALASTAASFEMLGDKPPPGAPPPPAPTRKPRPRGKRLTAAKRRA